MELLARVSERGPVVEIGLQRSTVVGRLRVSLSSLDLGAHSALTGLRENEAVTLAIVNVLDVAQSELAKAREDSERNRDS